jgi:ABC-type phosphonate transport system ATPase subunit
VTLLADLAESYPFESTPSFLDLADYHLPFDTLVSGAAVEAPLLAAAKRRERIALIASSGSGKSSVVAHTFGPTVDGVAPIVIQVKPLPVDAVCRPEAVAGEILRSAHRYSEQLGALAPGERDRIIAATAGERRLSHGSTTSAGFGLGLGWLTGQRTTEVMRQSEFTETVGLAEKTATIAAVLEIARRDGLHPVLIFDDTDRWLGGEDAVIVDRFFDEVLRWLASDVDASVVVAVHDRYVEDRPDRLAFLDTRIRVPALTDQSQLAAMLTRRAALNLGRQLPIGEFAAREAIDALWAAYLNGSSVRRVVQLTHIALQEAIRDGASQVIGAAHVGAALVD